MNPPSRHGSASLITIVRLGIAATAEPAAGGRAGAAGADGWSSYKF